MDEGVRGHDLGMMRTALEYLRANDFRFVSLEELVAHVEEGRPFEQKMVCFTVDDGYWDQAEFGGELFAQYDCPATFFFSTGFLDGDLWLWDSRVEYILQQTDRAEIELTRTLPLRLDLRRQSRTAWAVDTVRRLTRIHAGKLGEVIEELAEVCGVEVPDTPPKQFAPMSWDDARTLRRRGMRIGPHSVTHSLLARLEAPQARAEVEESWARIREEIDDPTAIFAYPSGRDVDFGQRDEEIVRSLGFRAGVSAIPGYLRWRHARRELFSIRRFGMPSSMSDFVQYASGLELAKQLSGWPLLRGDRAADHV
jgi:peptidoglycan/xylan/chitin deacetylase (PgdA/CDA1 family)